MQTVNHSFRRDVVCVGETEGRALPLARVLAELPSDFPAAVFIVSPRGLLSSLLAVLGQCAALPVAEARHGESIEGGRVRVGPCDRQLSLSATASVLGDAGGEQRVTPSLARFFDSAAWTLGNRVICVVLGRADRDIGTGLAAIQAAGGLVLAEPRSSLEYADDIVSLDEMVPALVRLTAQLPVSACPPRRDDSQPRESK